MKISSLASKIIKYSFYLLLFLVPLILTPWNYELFEFNKMIAVYFFTIIILGAWLIKMIAEGKIRIQRTPLDIPITIFLITQFLSTLFSIDHHVSIWGYYSRFHGGLLSTICYIILYYAFVTNITESDNHEKARQNITNLARVPKKRGHISLVPSSLISKNVSKLIFTALLSGFLVSLYGILEHFGIDKDIWLQDVQNRVFSTLGQPNWLAAYLCILLPISVAFSLKRGKLSVICYLLSVIFYLTLLYTKSRSGFLAFWIANTIFWLLAFLKLPSRKSLIKPLLIFNLSFLILNFIVGSPFEKINKYFTLSSLTQKAVKKETPSPPPPSGPALETGGTESGEIRKIVWKGAIDIARHFPLFGTGVETFAFAYYRFKAKEHNLTSEWDFLYNKAHNEYLNYAATTGFLGLGSYLLIIFTFVVWFFKASYKQIPNFQNQKPKMKNEKHKLKNNKIFKFFVCVFGFLFLIFNFKKSRASDFGFRILAIALFTGWLSVLVTNFFGFSVVIVAIFFWLIPAISFVLSNTLNPQNSLTIKLPTIKPFCNVCMALILLFTFYFLLFTFKLWYADTLFAKGNNLIKANQHSTAYSCLQRAVNLNRSEPLYHDKLSLNLTNLANLAFWENEATLSAALITQALSHSQKATAVSPQNVNFWKTQTKLFYIISQIDENYLEAALESLLTAKKLAPTDAKISYNLGILYSQAGKTEKAIKTLKETVDLKPNYRDARFALALFYKEKGLRQEAINELKYILEKINPEDQEIKNQLEEWRR